MKKRWFVITAAFFLLFLIWTACVLLLDVQAVGPNGSQVGFASINTAFHELTGVHMGIYDATDLLGLVPIVCVLGFAGLGLWQLIKRRSLFKVDKDILILGGFFILVMAAFVFFEICVVNYRPILIEGVLEASYPSSTTLLALSVMPVVGLQLRNRLGNPKVKIPALIVIGLFTAFMVVGRLLCGVHWLSDIIGGVLLSTSLVMGYASLTVK